MRRLIGKFVRWSLREPFDADKTAVGIGSNPFGPDSAAKPSEDGKITVSVVHAMNGKVLEIGVFKPNPRGPDWTYSMYLCDPERSLPENIALCFAMKGLEQ